MRFTLNTNNTDGHTQMEAAQRLEESLVFSVAYEPPETLTDDLFGLDDTQLRHVVALTLAGVGVTQPIELSVLITDDEGLRALNRDFRGKDEATDVLSFPLLDAPLIAAPADQLWQPQENDDQGELEDIDDSDSMDDVLDDMLTDGDEPDTDGVSTMGDDESDSFAPEEQHLHLGDIALSRDAITRQAAQAGHSAAWECAYLLSHGALHLVGYDDHSEAGYSAMVERQEAVLALAGIAK